MSKKIATVRTNSEKQFLDDFKPLCETHQTWQVWSDFVTATACALANSVNHGGEHYEEREREYEQCIKRLGGVENAARLFSDVVEALEENPEQDFLGRLYMLLDLGNHWKGQFFTPYDICRLMAHLTVFDKKAEIEDKGWISILDPACGAGATLIATANLLKYYDIDYQNHALFVGQDIDRVAGLMGYIQLSLLGCAGYVTIGDSLTNPTVGKGTLFPIEQKGQEIWYTPMFTSDTWTWRRNFNLIDLFFQGLPAMK